MSPVLSSKRRQLPSFRSPWKIAGNVKFYYNPTPGAAADLVQYGSRSAHPAMLRPAASTVLLVLCVSTTSLLLALVCLAGGLLAAASCHNS